MLMNLFLDALAREAVNLHRNQVRIRFIGDRDAAGPPAGAAHGGCGPR